MRQTVSLLVILAVCVPAAWSVAGERAPVVSPYDDGNVMFDRAAAIDVRPMGGTRAGITIAVHASSAPNAYGSPSWAGYVANALYALENDLSSQGDRSTDPTGYERAPAEVPGSEIAVTSFRSWRGEVEPAAPFDNEHGNRMHFGLHAYGDGSTQFTLEDLTFEIASSDPWNSLSFVGDFIGYGYSSTRYGIDWGPNRVKGGGDDVVYTSGNGTTLVDEIVYVGVGNAWWPGGDDDTPSDPDEGKQQAMDDFLEFIADYGPISVSCTYAIIDDTGSASVDVVPSPGLTLDPDLDCYAVGDTVSVGIWMRDVDEDIVGGQFFLEYDDGALTFVGATAAAPFDELYFATPAAGQIDYSVSTGVPPVGSATGDALMATLEFTANVELCSAEYLVTFRPHDPPTRLSDDVGQPVYPYLGALHVIDTEPPVLTCPPDVVVECDESTDPDDTGYPIHFEGFEDEGFEAGGPVITGGASSTGPNWNRYNSDLVRVASGTGGITSKSGGYHGLIDSAIALPPSPDDYTGAFTRLGGYSSTFPSGGFTTSLDVYMDLTDPAVAADTYGWDCSTAVNNQAGSHRRDFIFHTASNASGEILVAASNNTNFTRRDDLATINHYTITTSGWYTFQWVFRDAGDGTLAVDCNLLDAGGAWLWTETRNDGSDVIATEIGGNRYMWFTFLEVDTLAIDNTTQAGISIVTDNCDPDPTLTSSDSAAAGSCPQESVITRTWTATDACGNSSSCEQTITVVDTTDPVITCPDDIVDVYADAGLCSATLSFVETFDDPVPVCPTQSPDCWYVDRYAPAAFESFDFGGENVLKHSISSADSYGNRPGGYHSTFYNYQGRKYDVDIPVGFKVSVDLYIPADWASDARHASLWATVLDSSGSITGYPIMGFTANDPADPTNPNPGVVVPRFRVWKDEDPGSGWVELGLPTGFAYDAWYTLEFEVTDTEYNYKISGTGVSDLTYTYPKTEEMVRIANVMLQAYNFSDATYPVGDSYDVYWDNMTLGPTGPIVTDNCCIESVDYERSDGAGLTLFDPFPVGTTTVTWTATDCCGNTASCPQTVTVLGESEMSVNVQLSPTVAAGPIERCITFELWECPDSAPAEVVQEVLEFTGGLAHATLLVPCGNYTCITARDTLHTLRRTDESFGIVGTQYVADFTDKTSSGGDDDRLIGGNLNDDFWIDILDFGVFSSQYATGYGTADTTCSTPYPHADINGNAVVDTPDFTFIQTNFLLGHQGNCCGAPGLRGGEGGDGPITRIHVKDVEARGLGHLSVADLNDDQWLDEADIAAFMLGARPQPRPVFEAGKKAPGTPVKESSEPRSPRW